jgi:GST-like protein
MIDLYTWPTPNGQKIHIMLEELRLAYQVFPIDIAKGDQFGDDFLKISPNNKIPAIVDYDGPNGQPISVFETGAILMYLAEKADSDLFPQDRRSKYEIMQWLMFQMGGLGPMLGQAHHFRMYAPEEVPYAIERYTKEAARLYGVMDKVLSGRPYLAGQYSIADIACFPWINSFEKQGQNLNDFPNVKRWYLDIYEREAVQKGMAVLIEKQKKKPYTPEELKTLFNIDQK